MSIIKEKKKHINIKNQNQKFMYILFIESADGKGKLKK